MVATSIIASVATHPEGRNQVTDLVVRTLERLLDASANIVKARGSGRWRWSEGAMCLCSVMRPMCGVAAPFAIARVRLVGQANAALVVSRHRHKDWDEDSYEGKLLLDCCIKLVNAPESDRAARERGVEALSVLCLKLRAKERVVKECLPARGGLIGRMRQRRTILWLRQGERPSSYAP